MMTRVRSKMYRCWRIARCPLLENGMTVPTGYLMGVQLTASEINDGVGFKKPDEEDLT